MSNIVITIGELKEQGKLQKGDTLHHSQKGWHTVAYVRNDAAVCVRDSSGNYETWHIDFPEDVKVI